jgi:TM2 domain-containing membrane protein YozV
VNISSFCEKCSFPTKGKNLENITKINAFILNSPSSDIRNDSHDKNSSSELEYSSKQRILKNPGIAAQLSIIPGLGQIYTGQYQKGILLGLITTILIFFPFIFMISDLVKNYYFSSIIDLGIPSGNVFSTVLLFFPAIIFWLYNLYDAKESAKKVNSGLLPFKPVVQDILFLYPVVIITFVIIIGSLMAFILLQK